MMGRPWVAVFATVLAFVSAGCGPAAGGAGSPADGPQATAASADRPGTGTSAGAPGSPPGHDGSSPDAGCDDIGPDGGACATPTRNGRPAPDVVGMRVLAACEALSRGGYEGGLVVGEAADGGVGPGRVVSQDPRAGRRGRSGAPVELVSSGPYPAKELRRNPGCQDATQYGPGGRPNEFPNGRPNRAERR